MLIEELHHKQTSATMIRFAFLQFIPVDGMNLGIEPTIISLLPRDLVVAFGHVESSLGREFLFHHADKVLVVSDNYQLEVGLGGTRGDDLGQGNRQTSFVFVIKIGSGLIDSNKKKGRIEYVRESKSL